MRPIPPAFDSVAARLALIIALTLLLAACNKNESGSAGSAAGNAGSDAANAAQDAAAREADNEPIDAAAFGQVKSMMQMQVEGMATQADTWHKIVAEHPDAQLSDLVSKMDAKVSEARKLLDKASGPAQSRTLKVDVPRLLTEAGELGTKFTVRMQEVLKPAAGGGG